jgi:hypothetical protein
MSVARRHLNATLLPDGNVLVTGGTYGPGHSNETTPAFSAELWNPATETWTTLASASVPRLYHSSAVLLPDGRVVTTGGDNITDLEAFSPPYLFKGARPTLSGVPARMGYGQRWSMQSPEAADISKVTLIRLSSVTHAFDQNQRMNVLQFTAGTGAIDITIPANPNLAPPGHYMLFAVNSNGVPSIGAFVRISADAPPPQPPAAAPALNSLSPNTAVAGGPAFTLTVNGTNFASGATVRWNGAARPTTFVSTTQLRASITAADIAAAGTAQVTVANSGASVSNPLTLTVVPGSTLAVTRSGTAATRGTITSSPAGITCGDTCTAAFATGGSVTLTIKSSGNTVFAGWSGACSGTGTCTVTMDGNKSVTATSNNRR